MKTDPKSQASVPSVGGSGRDLPNSVTLALGQNVKRHRHAAKLSQMNLAFESEMDLGLVSGYYQFRDEVLLRNFFGRIFVKGYYIIAPPLARALRLSPSLIKSSVVVVLKLLGSAILGRYQFDRRE